MTIIKILKHWTSRVLSVDVSKWTIFREVWPPSQAAMSRNPKQWWGWRLKLKKFDTNATGDGDLISHSNRCPWLWSLCKIEFNHYVSIRYAFTCSLHFSSALRLLLQYCYLLVSILESLMITIQTCLKIHYHYSSY